MSFPNAPFVFNASVPSGGSGAVPVYVTVIGTAAAPQIVSPAVALQVALPTFITTEFNFIASSGGAVVMSANPQIDPSTVVGKTIIMTGTSNTNTVTFVSGNGLILNGSWTAKNGSMLSVYFDGINYREASRNDI